LQYGYVFNVARDYISIAKYDTNGNWREIGPSHSIPWGFEENASTVWKQIAAVTSEIKLRISYSR
jgi:hypothetical protein